MVFPDNAKPTTTLAQIEASIGRPGAPSRWIEVDQARIDRFADLTEDWQFIHVDRKAAAETPFGGTIAHGFLTLSLLSAMAIDALPQIEGQIMGVNYEFDKIRFLAPVPAGSRVRGQFSPRSVAKRGETSFLIAYDVNVEIEGSLKPAFTAIWLTLAVFA